MSTASALTATTIQRQGRFEPLEIDESPSLLAQSYQLRYQVYCLERKFLSAADYANSRETDRFDDYSIHVGAVDRQGVLAGTARLVPNGPLGLPLQYRCQLSPHYQSLLHSSHVFEISRLSVSRAYCRRREDTFYDGPAAVSGAGPDPLRRRGGLSTSDVFLWVLTALYRASKRLHATHWLMAVERSLHRILRGYGLPLRRVGPESDYFGPVTPYVIDLAELDTVIMSHRFPALDALPLPPPARPHAQAGELMPAASAESAP